MNNEIKKNIDNTINLFSQIKNSVPNIIKKIQTGVEEKTKEYHKIYEKEKERKLKEEVEKIEQLFEEAKFELLECLSVIKNKNLQDQKLLENKIIDLSQLMENKNYFSFSSKTEIIYYKLKINVQLSNKKIYFIKIKNKNSNNEKIEFDSSTRYIYLQSSVFEFEDIQNFSTFIKENNNQTKINIKDKVKIEECSINIFDTSMKFNPEVKKRMINDSENSIRINETKITFNGEPFKRDKLDDFIKAVQKFDLDLLKKLDKYDDNLLNKIRNILDTIQDLNKFLNMKTSNGKENDYNIENNIRLLKIYMKDCKEYLISNLVDIRKIIALNEEIEGGKIFLENHNSFIVYHKEPKNNDPMYISNDSYLKYPMISNSGDNITFSSKSFEMFLGSYIPSILSTPIIIKLLNLKQNKIKGFIKNCNINIVNVDENDVENTLKIKININNIKSDKFNQENITFQLEINSKGYKELIIPFNLRINLIPLTIIFSSLDYKLIYDLEKKEFNLNSENLYANSRIQFHFNYFYKSKIENQLNNNIVYFDYSLHSLENNKSIIKPILEKEDNKLTLIIPNNDDKEDNIINFKLKIYFSSTFYVSVKFNSKIYLFDFKFKWYSYNEKKFTTDNINIYIDIDKSKNNFPRDYILYFKVEKISGKADYTFDHYLPKEIEIIENDFDKKNNKTEFIFSLKLRITNKPFRIIENYYIGVIGNQIYKKLIVFPKIFPKKTNLIKELYDLPKYRYLPTSNSFIEEDKIDNSSLYITPFHYYIPYIKIIYQRKYSIIEGNYEQAFNFLTLRYSFKKQKMEKKKFDDKNEYINILGIFNGNKWYPMVNMETDEEDIYKDMKYLEYKTENIQEANNILDKIDKYTNFWIVPGIITTFYDRNNKDNILQMIYLLPESLKKDLSEEIIKLNENIDGKDTLDIIILNNLIYYLYNSFKKIYEEIKSNNDIFYLTDIRPPKNLLENIEQKNKEYFKIKEEELTNIRDTIIEDGKEKNNNMEGYNLYILYENKNPESKEKIEQITIPEEEKIEMKETKSDKFDLSNIKLNELNLPSSNSLKEIIGYYNNCNKIINILYFYIISASKSMNIENQIKAGNYYQKLEYIDIKYKSKNDYSFFAKDINDFVKGFRNLYYKLDRIGFKFKRKGELRRIDFNNDDNYIIWPKQREISKTKDNWSTEQNKQNNQFRTEKTDFLKLKVNRLNNNNKISLIDENNSDSEEEIINNNKNKNNEVRNIRKEEAVLEKIKIVDINDDNFENNYEEEEDNDKESINDDNIDKNANKIKLGKIRDELVVIDPTNINEKNFKEEDGIKRALSLLEEEKKKKESNILQNFDLGNPNKYHKFNNMDIFNINQTGDLSIKNLYEKSSFLANQLFIKINEVGKVRYSDTLVIILLDPSVYISEEIKILNMFIVCAMTNALNCLEIKYSIILMGDEDFRCVLKNYNEPHSIEALERVYECLILRRFRTNIPGCLKYALEEVSSKTDFKYTSFFVFTDGLDKRFVITQKNTWDSDIFYKKSNSFGFIFLLSSVLTSENKTFLNEIWNQFLTETKKNSRSGIFLESLELRIDGDFKNKINEIFAFNLIRNKYEESSNEIKYIKPLFQINNENSTSDFIKNSIDILDDKVLFKLNGSFIKNDIIPSSMNTNKEPLDTNYFKNNLHQIAKKQNDKLEEHENNSINFAHKFLSIRTNLNRGILEEIFKPNKANLKILSNTGTEIDIMALMLYFLNPVPDPLIYLQDAIGNIKEYAITVIIDTSFSVLNHFNINHSLNTIRVLLTSFTIIDLPSFDLIITGENGPIVLCSEYPTFAALNEKSKIWELFCHCLSNPISNVDLLSALQAAFDLKRMRTNNFPSFLFVLTDGLFEEDKQNKLKEIIAKLVQNNIQVIGIGLGSYPYGINNIFGQAIYDINPSNLLSSILSILEGNISEKNDMNFIQKEEESEKNILSAISKLIKNKKYYYKSLREELKQSPLTTNCYDMINDEVNAGFDDYGNPKNPDGEKIGLLKENALLGQTILIVMLWSYALNPREESELLDPKYIEQTNEKNFKSIKTAVDYLGVDVKYVLNYEDAIKEITKKDKNGKCNYYTVWVMCGPQIDQLPDFSKYPGLVEQFIDCLLIYWNNGGSVILFCENNPLFFQANLFLEKIRFKGEIDRTSLRIEGCDDGQQDLIGHELKGNLTGNCVYDTSTIRLPNKSERLPIGRNVPKIYEGETISHANSNDKDAIKPFIPFALDSSGNISIMIYPTTGKEGDIIIDCGYTKLFVKMSEGDIATWRYIQNLAGFLSRPEVHMIYDDGETAKNYRPNGVNFEINYMNLYTDLKHNYGTGELDIVYMIDSTGSMSSWISGVKEKCKEILDKLNENSKARNYDIKFGGVFYRDPIDSKGDINDYQSLGDVNSLKNKMMSISATGGGDLPEDWVGGYTIALDQAKMNWRPKSIKIIIHIADAGAHGERFSPGDRYNEYEYQLVELIKSCARKDINILGYQIGTAPQKSFSECESIYNEAKNKGNFEIYQFEHASDKEVAEKLKENVANHITAFIAKN